MLDDFNTPIALSVLFDLVRETHKLQISGKDEAILYAGLLKYLGNLLGLLKQDPEAFLKQGQPEQNSQVIEELIQKRLIARQNKDFALSDSIRDDLM
jgi:cysteinyl-tRNA synthetase